MLAEIGFGLAFHTVVATAAGSLPTQVIMSPAAIKAGVKVYISRFPAKYYLRIEFNDGIVYDTGKFRIAKDSSGSMDWKDDSNCDLLMPLVITSASYLVHCTGGSVNQVYNQYSVASFVLVGFRGTPLSFFNGKLYYLEEAPLAWPVKVYSSDFSNRDSQRLAFTIAPKDLPDRCMNYGREDHLEDVFQVKTLTSTYFTLEGKNNCGYAVNLNYRGEFLRLGGK